MTHHIARRGPRDSADNASTTANIAVGGRYFGRIDAPGDSDWIAINLVAGVTYTFNLGPGAANAAAAVPLDTTLGIYDASGTLLAFNNDVGWTGIFNDGIAGNAHQYSNYSFLEFTPNATGTYYLAAGIFDGSQVGDYVLSAFAGDLPYGNNTAAVLDVGGSSLTSTLEQSGDTDSFAVSTVAGEYYTVLVTHIDSPLGLLGPSVAVRDINGTVIGGEPNFFDLISQVTFQATSSTTWLDVAGYIPGFDVGRYSIHIEKASLTDAIEANWVPLPASVAVYFVGDVEVTNGFGESYFAPAWTDGGVNAALRLFQQYSEVANITFTVVDDPAKADVVMANRLGVTHEAGRWFHTGNTEIDGVTYNTAMVELYLDRPGMTEGDFAPGTFGYLILSHEFGHGFGLSHPFRQPSSDATIPGVLWNFEQGDFALGQGVYTQMSYNAGFREKDGTFPFDFFPESPAFGSLASPATVDIAALQQVYGANTTTRIGNDTYVLPDENAAGTGYVAIWDNGGTDAIAAAATNTSGATIDLRAASLDFDALGGGAVSWARGVWGGFTIAHDVVVENAIGAAGDDRLVGNAATNRLEGRAGHDEMGGGAGDDRLLGGGGNDRLFGDVLPGKASGIGFGSGLVVSAAGADNNTFETAWDITNAFALFADPDVAKAHTIPHVTVDGTGDGSIDLFKITLEKGATLTIDMDNTTGGYDAAVGIFDLDLRWLAVINDGLVTAGAGGSVTRPIPTVRLRPGMAAPTISSCEILSPKTSPWARAMRCMSRSRRPPTPPAPARATIIWTAAMAMTISTAAPGAIR
jgi:serralysin